MSRLRAAALIVGAVLAVWLWHVNRSLFPGWRP